MRPPFKFMCLPLVVRGSGTIKLAGRKLMSGSAKHWFSIVQLADLAFSKEVFPGDGTLEKQVRAHIGVLETFLGVLRRDETTAK